MERAAAAVSLLLAAAAPEAETELVTLSAHERAPIAVLFTTPSGEAGRVRVSEAVASIADRLGADTDFEVELIDDAVAGDCAGRLHCLVPLVRPDFERDAAERSPRRYLLLFTALTTADAPDLWSVILVDTDRALALDRRSSRDDPEWASTLESAINSEAVIARSERAEIRDLAAAEAFLARFVASLETLLEGSGHWRPYGTLELTLSTEDAVLKIDEGTVGTIAGLRARVSGLRPGKRQLLLEHAGYTSYKAEVNITRGQVATHTAVMLPLPAERMAFARDMVFFGGLGVAAIGVAVTVLAVAAHDSATVLCPAPAGGSELCPAGHHFVSTGYDSSDPSSGGGVLIAPLGYSLIATGGTWAAGTALFGEDDDPPWWQLGVGLALGLTAYGLSAIAN